MPQNGGSYYNLNKEWIIYPDAWKYTCSNIINDGIEVLEKVYFYIYSYEKFDLYRSMYMYVASNL